MNIQEQRMKILLVDDRPANLFALKNTLGKRDQTCVAAGYDEYVGKPMNRERPIQVLGKHLSDRVDTVNRAQKSASPKHNYSKVQIR